jgi:hypothetical protein
MQRNATRRNATQRKHSQCSFLWSAFYCTVLEYACTIDLYHDNNTQKSKTLLLLASIERTWYLLKENGKEVDWKEKENETSLEVVLVVIVIIAVASSSYSRRHTTLCTIENIGQKLQYSN